MDLKHPKNPSDMCERIFLGRVLKEGDGTEDCIDERAAAVTWVS